MYNLKFGFSYLSVIYNKYYFLTFENLSSEMYYYVPYLQSQIWCFCLVYKKVRSNASILAFYNVATIEMIL